MTNDCVIKIETSEDLKKTLLLAGAVELHKSELKMMEEANIKRDFLGQARAYGEDDYAKVNANLAEEIALFRAN
jgi:hypothetical protein